MNNEKLKNILLYAFPAAAAIVNGLPWCVRLQFMGEGGMRFVEYYSGYSLLPPGYGVWTHMITGICGIILTVLGLLHFRSQKSRLLSWMMTISIVGALMSVSSIILGTGTVVSALATVGMVAEVVLLYRWRLNG